AMRSTPRERIWSTVACCALATGIVSARAASAARPNNRRLNLSIEPSIGEPDIRAPFDCWSCWCRSHAGRHQVADFAAHLQYKKQQPSYKNTWNIMENGWRCVETALLTPPR